MAPMPDEAPVISAKAAVAGFDAVLIDPLLSVLFASHHLGGNRPPFSTVLALVLTVPAARRACQTIADCNAACQRPGLGPARATSRQMIDESTSVVDGDLTDFGAEHFS